MVADPEGGAGALDAAAAHPDDEAGLPGWLLDRLADLDGALTRAGLRGGYRAEEHGAGEGAR